MSKFKKTLSILICATISLMVFSTLLIFMQPDTTPLPARSLDPAIIFIVPLIINIILLSLAAAGLAFVMKKIFKDKKYSIYIPLVIPSLITIGLFFLMIPDYEVVSSMPPTLKYDQYFEAHKYNETQKILTNISEGKLTEEVKSSICDSNDGQLPRTFKSYIDPIVVKLKNNDSTLSILVFERSELIAAFSKINIHCYSLESAKQQ